MDDRIRESLKGLKDDLTDLGLSADEIQQNLEGASVDAVRTVLGLQPGDAFPDDLYGAIHQGVSGIMNKPREEVE